MRLGVSRRHRSLVETLRISHRRLGRLDLLSRQQMFRSVPRKDVLASEGTMFLKNRSLRYRLTSVVCAALLLQGDRLLMSQAQPQPQSQPPSQSQPAGAGTTPTTAAAPGAPAAANAPAQDKPKTADELDSLVAPIALYPDPLLAQVLAASTYPLDIVEASRWLKANPNLKGEELTKAATKEDWDASVQALVAFPDALKRLDESIKWTMQLGNAFLDQQSDVMDAVQRMRMKAKNAGKLESSKEQTVEVKTIESKTIVEIQPSNPEVIYVPSYNPTVVYGAAPYPYYPYPPMYYPPYYGTGAYVATAAISFGVGVAMGAMWSGGCCGWGMGWGNNDIEINNNFQRQNNLNGGDRNVNRGQGGSGSSRWQHNGDRRGSVPYGSRDSAQKFGGGVRGEGGTQRFDRSGQARPASTGQFGGAGGGSRVLGEGTGAGGRNLGSGGAAGLREAGAGAGVGTRDVGGAGAGADRVGNRNIQSRSGAERSAFGGGGSRSGVQSNSNRGASSSRSSGVSRSGGGASRSGGGFSRGGGGGGGMRGGGGGRRR